MRSIFRLLATIAYASSAIAAPLLTRDAGSLSVDDTASTETDPAKNIFRLQKDSYCLVAASAPDGSCPPDADIHPIVYTQPASSETTHATIANLEALGHQFSVTSNPEDGVFSIRVDGTLVQPDNQDTPDVDFAGRDAYDYSFSEPETSRRGLVADVTKKPTAKASKPTSKKVKATVAKPKPTAAKTTKPKVTAVKTTKSKATAVKTTKPKVTAVKTAKPKVTAVKTTSSKVTAVKTTSSKVTAVKTTSSKVTAVKTIKPKATAVKTTKSKTTPVKTTAKTPSKPTATKPKASKVTKSTTKPTKTAAPKKATSAKASAKPTATSSGIVINSPADAAKYITPPPKDKAIFWSGVPFDLSQSFAKKIGMKTLELSVGKKVTADPQASSSNPQWDLFWGNLSVAFGQVAVGTKPNFVTVELRAPNQLLTGPSDPFSDGRMVRSSDWARNEMPALQRSNVRIMAVHPLEQGKAATDAYQVWPKDEGSLWQKRNGGGAAQTTSVKCAANIKAMCVNGKDSKSAVAGVGKATSIPLENGGACSFTASAPSSAGQAMTVKYTTTTSSLKMTFACA